MGIAAMILQGELVYESMFLVDKLAAWMLIRFSPAKLHRYGHVNEFAVEEYDVFFARPRILYMVLALEMVKDAVYVMVNLFVVEFSVIPYPTGRSSRIAVMNVVAL